jgi:SAM-dependent methyltransferase
MLCENWTLTAPVVQPSLRCCRSPCGQRRGVAARRVSGGCAAYRGLPHLRQLITATSPLPTWPDPGLPRQDARTSVQNDVPGEVGIEPDGEDPCSAGGDLPCGTCLTTSTARSGSARRRRPTSGTQSTASEMDRCGGRPNGRLLAEVVGLSPGRALDVGCGEGADAIWLARGGWTVTAIDVSAVAVGRARAAAELAGASIEWICGDVLETAFAAHSFALVSMLYPALPKAAGEVAVRRLLDSVRPGGVLLAVCHDIDHEHREHMKSRGVDPADYLDADDLVQLLGDEFSVELHANEARIDPPPDNPHTADIVLRARRR